MLQKVVRSAIIDAHIERVWAVLRDFNSHDQWHSAIESSHIEGGERSDQVGCVRNFRLKDGNQIREQLLTLSDSEHKSTYCIVEASLPLQRYVATVSLKPVTDGNRTFWHWESSFATPPGLERELRDTVAQGVYETGFEDLRRYLRGGADQRSPGAGPMPTALPVSTRRIAVARYGGPDALWPQNAEAAAPGAGEVRIRQRAVGVNFIDVYLRRGWVPSMFPVSEAAPGVPGMEAAGGVLDVGPQVTGFLPGDRVAYLGPVPGAYCGVRSVPADWVVRLPPEIEDETAAALLLKGITADYLLRDLGHVQRGTRLLVHAAAGGVGLLVCAWARRLGAVVIGTVSSEDKARVAREHGCEHVVVTRDYRFADAVQRLCGGADVVIDGLGDAARDENLAALARRGHWISLGQASGPLQPLPPDALVAKSLSFSRPVVFDYVSTPAQLAERAQRVWQALADGAIRLPPIERFPLDAAAQAHERLESRATIGALVLLP
ncbi:SRPBCC family protein [Variovorax saccharolyticus]|uniref:SRPBCC family protein n=1 Tax=Variovorax saccharolyticus TaxID=3053516 RepID=UPI00257701D0|nr:SRPBCC family protein [Variovorax sp. J22R187]MDM0022017.1 SRPBCC family protein [Variovorax sp. J22R187]